MTNDEINKKIAEFCNWGDINIPYSCEDLNVIHEAEKQLLIRDDADVYWPLYVKFLDRNSAGGIHIPAIIKAECLVQIINLIEQAELEEQEDEI